MRNFTGHCTADAVIASGNLSAAHFDLHEGDLQIDAGGSVSALVAAGDLNLIANTEISIQGTAIGLVATGADGISLAGGDVFMPNLPTTDPGITGKLWNDNGTLKVS